MSADADISGLVTAVVVQAMIQAFRENEVTRDLVDQMKMTSLSAISSTQPKLVELPGGAELCDALYDEVERLFAVSSLNGGNYPSQQSAQTRASAVDLIR